MVDGEASRGTGVKSAAITVHASHDGVLVIDKPAGIPTTGRVPTDLDSVEGQLRRQLRRDRLWAVHQLDRGTTGLNLFVKRKALVATVGRWLTRGHKDYLAVCHGHWSGPARELSAPIGRLSGPRQRGQVVAVMPQGKEARTFISPLATTAHHCVLRVRIVTGRTHQVRVHLAHLGHPLVGEFAYRDPACVLHPRVALHAWRLLLPDAPECLQRVVAPRPADLAALIEALHLGDAAGADHLASLEASWLGNHNRVS